MTNDVGRDQAGFRDEVDYNLYRLTTATFTNFERYDGEIKFANGTYRFVSWSLRPALLSGLVCDIRLHGLVVVFGVAG